MEWDEQGVGLRFFSMRIPLSTAESSSVGRPFRPALAVRESRIPGAGQGLFALETIPPDTVLAAYTGTALTTVAAIRRADKSYLMRLGPQAYVDALDHPGVTARYINDCRNSALYNVRFDKQPESWRALVITTRRVEVGEELYVDYGRIYWFKKKPSRIP